MVSARKNKEVRAKTGSMDTEARARITIAGCVRDIREFIKFQTLIIRACSTAVCRMQAADLLQQRAVTTK